MKLFGKSAVDKGFEAFENVANKLDDRKFTSEEKSRVNLQMAEGFTEFAKAVGEANTPKSRQRRILAYIVFANVSAFTWLIIYLRIIGKIDTSKAVLEIVIELGWKEVFLTVVAFFFGSYLIMQGIKLFNRKKDK